MAQRFRDEAGNIWEAGPDGQPRLVEQAQRPNLANPKMPFELQQAQGQAAASQFAAPTAQANLQGQNLGNQRTAQDIGLDRVKAKLQIKQQFESDLAVKLYKQSLPELAKAMKANTGKQGDLNVVYSFAKVMDPGSVVREGEIEFANASASLIQRAKQYIGMINQGKGLPPEVRQGLLREMNAAVAEYGKGYAAVHGEYAKLAQGAGFDPDEVVGRHFGESYRQTFDEYRKAHGSKEVRNEDQSAALAAMIRGGVSYEDAAKWAQSVGGNLPREQYEAALTYARKNPGQANTEVFNRQPLSPFERAANALPVGPADIGFVHGAKQALDRAAMGLEAGANLLPGIESNSAQRASQQSEQMFAGLPGHEGFQTAGRLAGAGILTAPLAGPMTAGAAGNLLMSDSRGLGENIVDAGLGAIGGKVGDMVLRGASGLVAPQGREAMQRLSQEGVGFSPGQMIGPRARNWEDRLTANPVLGPRIDAIREEGLRAANKIPANRALSHIGQQLPPNVRPGHQAVDYTQQALSGAYNNALAGKQIGIDPTFVTRLNALGQRANLRPQEFNEAAGLVQREIGGAFQAPGTPLGAMSGRQFKQLDEKLGDYSSAFGRSDDPYKREIGGFVADTRDEVKALARRQSPEMAQSLRAADDGWADFSILRRAASASPEDGIFTPGQLRAAVRQNDRSASKGATARGQARMQDLASDMSETMPSTVGSSGTSEREQAGKLMPYLLGTALSPLYSNMSQKAIEKALLRSAGPEAQAIAKRLRALPRGMFGGGFPLLIESQLGNY